MNKFIITWDAGYGEESEVVEADNLDDATEMAREAWKEDAESNAVFFALEYDKDTAVDLGLEDFEDE